jgi:predicted amidohydrolase YtcJ
MRLAGVTRDTPTPVGGRIVRDRDGNPTGWLIDAANALAECAFPLPPFDEQVASIGRASLDSAAHGITTVRDAYVNVDEMPLLQVAWQSQRLAATIWNTKITR